MTVGFGNGYWAIMLALIFFFLFTDNLVFEQPYIHAHNDYQHPQPLVHAIENKVFSLEADLFLVNGKLRVAHDKEELDTAPKLKSLYLKPIIKLFKKHRAASVQIRLMHPC